MKRMFLRVASVAVSLVPVLGHAAEGLTWISFLHAGAGISMPSQILSLDTQPAAIGSLPSVRVSVQGEAADFWQDGDYRAVAHYGSSWFGVAGSFQRTNENTEVAGYGLSVQVPAGWLSVGISGSQELGNGTSEDLRAGVLIRPASHFRLGFTALGLNDQVREYGYGLSMELTPGAALILDAASDPDFEQTDFKGGLRLGTSNLGLSASLGTGDGSQITKGFSGGAFLRFGSLSALEFQYRPTSEMERYFASLTLGF